jgi:hypothetical protein
MLRLDVSVMSSWTTYISNYNVSEGQYISPNIIILNFSSPILTVFILRLMEL